MSSLISAAMSIVKGRAGAPPGGGGGMDIGSGDPRWADVLMLVDFTGQNGNTSVTDVKNGDVYTLYGTSHITGDQLFTGSASYASTPDSSFHDAGGSPDTIEFLRLRLVTVSGGYQCIASNYDGTAVAFTLQLNNNNFVYNTANGAQYSFTVPGLATGVDYHLAFTRTSGGTLNMWLDGTKHATEYTGVTQTIAGSVNSFTFGNLPSETGINQAFDGRIGAFRMTDGAPRYTTNFTAPTSFSHSA